MESRETPRYNYLVVSGAACVVNSSYVRIVLQLLLLLCGDIELNPGPGETRVLG